MKTEFQMVNVYGPDNLVASSAFISREQRRYEIARDCMAALFAYKAEYGEQKEIATLAVEHADALLAELERQ